MSGAQFGDPKELRPVALGEAPFGIRLYDSRPDGRPPVSEKMLNQTMKGLDFSACQIGSDRRCATRTGHGEPVGPDHSLEFRRHKSRMASCADSPGVILRTRHTGSSTKGVRRSTGLLHRRFATLTVGPVCGSAASCPRAVFLFRLYAVGGSIFSGTSSRCLFGLFGIGVAGVTVTGSPCCQLARVAVLSAADTPPSLCAPDAQQASGGRSSGVKGHAAPAGVPHLFYCSSRMIDLFFTAS
ncbi:uncharacterized protein [Nerophis lumbriciformis]|uniref:uncharacterized protein isoform X2 n=1 Tax=Nerophis lumbriciformis TaxID=546530 RepID=UPI002ADFEAEB|nr:uncharacterized protein LOC133579586 isoform X1 [Nerophis lumbriciformis]